MRHILIATVLFFAVGCSSSDNAAKTAMPDKPGEIKVVAGDTKPDDVSPFIGYNVRGEHVVRFAPDGEENSVTREIGAHVVVRNTPYDSIHKSLLMKRLSKEFIVKCSACHDDYGNGVIGPSLLTKSADEITAMITAYKTSKARNILMQVLVSKMSDAEIRFIAEDIARFNEEIRKERSK